MTPTEAKDVLWKATVLIQQGKIIEAMNAVGMTFDWLEDMSMTEATEVFQVRVHNLRQIINGETNDQTK